MDLLVARCAGLDVGKDEVVFYVFDSASGEAVREACELAAIPFERIVASVHIKERLQ